MPGTLLNGAATLLSSKHTVDFGSNAAAINNILSGHRDCCVDIFFFTGARRYVSVFLPDELPPGKPWFDGEYL